MKRLTKIVPGLTLLALLFATPAAAAEIIMVCTDKKNPVPGLDYTLKFVEPLVGPNKVYRRGRKGWKDWSKPIDRHVWHEYEVGDRTVYVKVSRVSKADKDYDGANLQKGDEYNQWFIFEADFEFLKLIQKYWITQVNDRPLNWGKGFSRKDPHITKYTCKKHKPVE